LTLPRKRVTPGVPKRISHFLSLFSARLALRAAVIFAALPAMGVAQDTVTSTDVVTIVSALGPLANSLVMAISMDSDVNGGVVFSSSQAGTHAHIFGNKKFVQDEGRQCTSFAAPQTFWNPFGPVELGKNYTLATWAKLPFAGEGATVWDGIGSTPLHLAGDNFACSVRDDVHNFCPCDKSLTGWHHLAVSCDGSITSFYIDGVLRGSAPLAVDGKVHRVGSRTFSRQNMNTQCDLLDDMFMFNRALTAAELTKLTAVRLPVHEPPASMAKFGPMPSPVGPGGVPSGLPSFPNPIQIPPPAVSGEANDIIKTYRGSLVFVTGEGAGSGFIADLGGKNFLLTNAHVAAGVRGATFKTLEGAPVNVGTPAVAVGHDIFTMQAPAAGTPFEVMRDVGNNTAIGDDVVVLGNAEGGGVINTIMGHIVGVGPNLVEVDAPFQPGNSGSPIVHLKSKKVIGVATYLTIRKYDPATKEPFKEPVIRRFGYRIDSVKAWQAVTWPAFLTQATQMESIETLTKDLVMLIKDMAQNGHLTPGRHTNPAIKGPIDAWLNSRLRRMSVKDLATVDQNFVSYLKVASQSDILNAQRTLTYDYFQRQLSDQQQERAEIAGIFSKAVDRLKQDR
jgi:hypothetical protein